MRGIQSSPTVPMYQALAESLNLPAVATANDLGLDTVFEYGKNSDSTWTRWTSRLPLPWELV